MFCKHFFSILLLIISKFFEITAEMNISDFVSLATDIQDFYKSPSIFVVYDDHLMDFGYHAKLMETVKSFSRKLIMSQAITYDDIKKSDKIKNIKKSPMFTLFIENQENLQHFQRAIENRNTSSNPWLLLISKEVFPKCGNPQGNPFHLQINSQMSVKCEGNDTVKQYYSIFKNTTDVNDLGIWKSGGNLKFKGDKNSLRIRKDLKGITLRIAKHTSSYDESNKKEVKFVRSLLNLLKLLNNFKTEVTVEIDALGYFEDRTKQWIGIMEAMYKKKADIAAVAIGMTKSRLDIVDFPTSLTYGRFYFYMKFSDTTSVRWSTYFMVFNKYAWSGIGLLIFIVSVLIRLINIKCHRVHLSTPSFFENFFDIWGIFSQQGISGNPTRTSIKIIYFSILLASLILSSIYNAAITSYISVLTKDIPFSSYDDFKKNGEHYKVIALQGSEEYNMMMSNTTRLAPLQPRVKKVQDLPKNAYEGFVDVCNGKVAFYVDDETFNSIDSKIPCTLGTLRMTKIEFVSIALLKNSPYLEMFNYNILRLRNYGILNRMKNKYFYKYTELTIQEPNVISLPEVSPILAIFGIGLVMSLIILCFEIVCYRLQRSYNCREKTFEKMGKITIK